MQDSLSAFLTQFPVITLFGVMGIGYLLGQVRCPPTTPVAKGVLAPLLVTWRG